MNKSITVSYVFRDTIVPIELAYTIQMAGEVQTIACSVSNSNLPTWLQLRKFEIISQFNKGKYAPLFNETNNGKNLDTVLFIDTVYADIMTKEKLLVYS
jgi:hypothetical protein